MKSRRSFIKSVTAITAGIAVTGLHPLMASIPVNGNGEITGRKIHIFSKHLQWLGYNEMAETAKQIGFDGIDLTVRPNGHVLPENVKMDLPKAVKAIRNSGLLIDRITTAITDTDDPFTISILTTAAELGIGNYRLGWLSYDASISIKENLQFFNLKLQKLAALNRQLGIKGAYQNHAGDGVGGPVWDMSLLLDGIDPEILGIRYDIRHATVSGGLSWPVGLEYLADKINSIDLKDFVWKEKENKWQPVNVPLGEGMVDFDRFLKILKQKNINGDFTMHFEYELGGADTGTFSLTVPPETVISAMKRDLAVFKGWM